MERQSKRPRISSDTQEPPVVQTIHEVLCEGGSGREADHEAHQDLDPALYLDVPRLHQGDSKASPLRGQHRIHERSEAVEKASIIVYMKYSCDQYLDLVNDDFKPLVVPGMQKSFARTNRAHFYELEGEGPDATPVSMCIRLNDDDVVDRVNRVLATVGGPPLSGWKSETSLTFPFQFYFHHRQALHEAVEACQWKHLKDWIRALLDCIYRLAGANHAEAHELMSKGLINSDHFPKLFQVGDVVAAYHGDHLAGYRVDQIKRFSGSVSLRGWTYDYDGTFKKRYTDLEVVGPASNALKVSKLPAFPLRVDQTGVRDILLARGRNFWRCRTARYVSYSAPKPPNQSQTVFPRYMVDYEMYKALHQQDQEEPEGEKGRGLTADEVKKSDLSGQKEYLLLLPAEVLGYRFSDKQWRTLRVDHIKDVDWNDEAFKRLVLEDKKKNLIKALVSVHLRANRGVDIIEGKGNGLIILLHGGPGTGKTLTAESVAELARRPLYRVTCGDMGIEPERVEKYLESVFHIGTAWGCVVLLDEADIFLERRTTDDIKRNALVSVFLRVLEYYEGILILTTNRIGLFDEAFKSRIQLAVHFPSLDVASRRKVWRDALKSMPISDPEFDLPDLLDHIDDLAQKPLNGRQIRSTVHSAMQLATYQKEELQIAHFNDVIDIATEFDSYVSKTVGETDEQLARSEGLRY